jgi:aconitate hydratase
MNNSLGSRSMLRVETQEYEIYRLDALEKQGMKMARLPYSIRILLENLLRREDGTSITGEMIRSLASYSPKASSTSEISFMPSRFLLQDLTGVPAIVDLAAMRDAIKSLGGSASRINPLQPANLVVDHSVQVDKFGTPDAFHLNAEIEFMRNRERYAFLRWGQKEFENLTIVPPDNGICHQINLEFLAQVVSVGRGKAGRQFACPDTVIGTDSHTTMVNGLGVLGWGVGGIEAETAMLGQAIWMLVPQVVGVRLTGELPSGSTATDLVLTTTELLRKKGVVGKFVEYFGPGLRNVPLETRAVLANMSPENGSTCGIFPVDEETLRYLRFSGRPDHQVRLVEAYFREQGLFHTDATPAADYSDLVEFELGTVEPSIAGPKLPQQRVPLSQAATAFHAALPSLVKPGTKIAAASDTAGEGLRNGSIVIAAITSCTNTSNPTLMMAAGLVAKKAVALGVKVPAWVKTSLAPGSRVVTEYLEKAGLLTYLDQLGFNLVGYGCTTCIGNSGPLHQDVLDAIDKQGLVVAAVLSGNRNFEGRIHPEVRANYLMSPPLVVAFGLAGHLDWDVKHEPLGQGSDGKPVFLKDVWPTPEEVEDAVRSISTQMFHDTYQEVFKGNPQWQSIPVTGGDTYTWSEASTYVRKPPYFAGMNKTPSEVRDITGARVLVMLGDSITTDTISPAGRIEADSPAGRYLIARDVKGADFNTYGARRGNHEVLMRGTFANAQLKNKLVPNRQGPFTRHLPEGKETTIFEASEQYRKDKVPLLILAGREYGSGSSRDWAAKGPLLLGVAAVIFESIERIHRSNLVGMGILPLQFLDGQTAENLHLTGEETYEVTGIRQLIDNYQRGVRLKVNAQAKDGAAIHFDALARIDTPQEALYYSHGGIMPYVIRQLLAKGEPSATEDSDVPQESAI